MGAQEGVSADVALGVVPAAWRRLVLPEPGEVDRRVYTLWVMEELHQALRRRDVFCPASSRWADPRARLLDGERRAAMRPELLDGLGLDPDPTRHLEALGAKLDDAYRGVAAGLGKNALLSMDDQGRPHLSPDEALPMPASLAAPKAIVASMLPRVDLPELLIEVDGWTEFTSAFTHISSGESRMGDLGLSVIAVLVAEACNVGLVPVLKRRGDRLYSDPGHPPRPTAAHRGADADDNPSLMPPDAEQPAWQPAVVTAPEEQLGDVPRAAVGSAPPREVRAWYAYDWACSAFSTTVVAVFLGPYLTTVAEAAAGGPDQLVHPLGIPVRAGSFFPYVLSLSVFLQVFVLPLVGALADRAASRKRLLGIFAYLGASATMGLYLVRGDRYLLGGGLFLVANLAFGSALVVYNAFLPDLASPDERDSVSSRGWAFGYLGGGLLLAANLGLYTLRDRMGVAEGTAVRISLLSAGALFTLVPMRALPDRRRSAAVDTRATSGFAQLRTTLREARGYPQTLAFLAAYLLFNDGIQSVIALSATFGDRELGLSQTTLIVAILVVQIVAFGGALLLGRLARTFGAKRVILASLVVWILVLAAAYVLPAERPLEFFALASAIGLVLGGTQALSRSLFSQLIPPGREAAYFGLYEISERGTSWLGPALFGLSLQLTGSYRIALASLVVFFAVGFALLTQVDLRRAILEAGNQLPARL